MNDRSTVASIPEPPGVLSYASVICPACRRAAAAGATFCASCGTRLDSDAPTLADAGGTIPGSVTVPLQSGTFQGRFPPDAVLADRYRIVGLLARGGMGEVYRADDLVLGLTVA